MKNGSVIIILISIALCGGLYFSSEFDPQNPRPSRSTGEAKIGGGFALTDQYGKPRTDSEFRGKYMLVFFGFTNCPNICPHGLANMTHAMNSLGDEGQAIAPIFITVDPERDTVERMKEFTHNFHPAIVGLTGDKKDIEKVENAYRIYASRKDAADQPDGYTMDHSGFIYLMGKDGKYLAHFSYDTTPDEMVKKIKEYL